MLVEKVMLRFPVNRIVDLWSLHEYGGNRHSQKRSPSEAVYAKFPCLFLFPCSGEDRHHQEDDVCARGDVEQLEAEVPKIDKGTEDGRPEEIQVSGTEYSDIKGLCYERDALSRLLATV